MTKKIIKLAMIRDNKIDPCPFGISILEGCQNAGDYIDKLAPLDSVPQEDREHTRKANIHLFMFNKPNTPCKYAANIIQDKNKVNCSFGESDAAGEKPGSALVGSPEYNKTMDSSGIEGLLAIPLAKYPDSNTSRNSYYGILSLQGNDVSEHIVKLANKLWTKSISAEMQDWANYILNNPNKYPMNSEVEGNFNGDSVLARVEQHHWTYKGGIKTPGNFRGVTLYEGQKSNKKAPEENEQEYNSLIKELFASYVNDGLIKLANVSTPEAFIIQVQKLQTIAPENIEDAVFDLSDKIIDIKKYTDKLFQQIHELSKNAQLIQQNQEKLKEIKRKIEPYVDLDKNQVFNDVLKSTKKTINYQYWSEIYSIQKDLSYISDKFHKLEHSFNFTRDKQRYGTEKFYIRFGKYPKSERSRMGLDDEWVQELHGKRFENGVSVYNAYPMNGKWVIREPNKDKAVYNSRFEIGLFADQIAANEIYLVTGKEEKFTGVDGEPLLTDVFPIKKLSPNDILLSSDKDATTLQQWIAKMYSRHDRLGPFSMSDEKQRDISLWFNLFIEDLEDEKTANVLGLSEENVDELIEMYHKSKYAKELNLLSAEEMEKLEGYIKQYKAYRNKKQVMKGYRPFY